MEIADLIDRELNVTENVCYQKFNHIQRNLFEHIIYVKRITKKPSKKTSNKTNTVNTTVSEYKIRQIQQQKQYD